MSKNTYFLKRSRQFVPFKTNMLRLMPGFLVHILLQTCINICFTQNQKVSTNNFKFQGIIFLLTKFVTIHLIYMKHTRISKTLSRTHKTSPSLIQEVITLHDPVTAHYLGSGVGGKRLSSIRCMNAGTGICHGRERRESAQS